MTTSLYILLPLLGGLIGAVIGLRAYKNYRLKKGK